MRALAAAALCALACTEAAGRPAPPGAPAFATPSPDVLVLGVGEGATLRHQFHDSAGTPITAARPAFAADDDSIVELGQDGRVTGRAPGETVVTARSGSASAVTRVRVVAGNPDGVVLDVFPATEHQRITGWEAAGQLGEIDCHPTAYRLYQRELVDRIVNELGITRLRLSAQSGTENPHDSWSDFRAGRIPYGQWRRTWMVAVNDNADPFDTDPKGFQWGWFDFHVDTVFLPIRRALAARGESLYVNLNFVDFWLGAGSKAFPQMKEPEEYAELIRAVFDHMKARYGFVPDGVELNLEPENTPYSGTDMGRALVAVERRLREGGYAPDLIGPSTTKAANAPLYYDQMVAVPGARGLIDEISYHRYSGVSDATLRAILLRARRDGTRTAMLEHIGSGFGGLYNDLTVAHASAWEQFALAYCGNRDNAANPGVYYQINESDPEHPRINITNEAKLLRQVFAYVRPGAVRLGATSSDEGVRPLAFRNASGRMVAVAWTSSAAPISWRGLSPGTYGVNYGTAGERYNVDLPDVTVAPGQPVRLMMPSAGVITVYAR